MPKVKSLDPVEEPRMRTSACIARYMKLRGLNEEQLAKRLNISRQTMVTKLNNPGEFKMEMLWNLSRIFKCPISELCGGELPEERLESVLKLIGSR